MPPHRPALTKRGEVWPKTNSRGRRGIEGGGWVGAVFITAILRIAFEDVMGGTTCGRVEEQGVTGSPRPWRGTPEASKQWGDAEPRRWVGVRRSERTSEMRRNLWTQLRGASKKEASDVEVRAFVCLCVCAYVWCLINRIGREDFSPSSRVRCLIAQRCRPWPLLPSIS